MELMVEICVEVPETELLRPREEEEPGAVAHREDPVR